VPAAARIDRGAKLDLYARSGVREYWILDGEQRQLTSYVPRAGKYQVHHYNDVPVPSTAFPGFELDLPAILDA
jgi:Uma2 family endonuclease